jgi:hypothetical protein
MLICWAEIANWDFSKRGGSYDMALWIHPAYYGEIIMCYPLSSIMGKDFAFPYAKFFLLKGRDYVSP